MKAIFNTAGKVIDSLLGAAGGVIFSILVCMTIFNLQRMTGSNLQGIWIVYVGLMILGPIVGLLRRDYFTRFSAPMFNAVTADDNPINGVLGPDNTESNRNCIMSVVYLIAVVLMIVATLFAATIPTIIATISLVIYSVQATRVQN